MMRGPSRQLFASVKKWRATDQHTGIDKHQGVLYTYRHLEGRARPAPRADVYRVETFIEFTAPMALHGNVHYVPASNLEAFFDGWGEHGETVIDIRPLTIAEALAEIAAFRTLSGKGGA